MVGAIERRDGADGEASVRRHVVVVAAYAALCLFVALAALLVVRRLSGAFQRPLGGASIVLAVAVVEMVASGLRRVFRDTALAGSVLRTEYLVLNKESMRPLGIGDVGFRVSAVEVLCTFSVLAIAVALCVRGTPVGGLLMAGLVVIGAEFAQRLRRFRLSRHVPLASPDTQVQTAASVTCDDDIAEPEIAPGLVQQLTRIVEEGRETIHGLLKAEVAANDRLAVVHIAFCPPLRERPELSAHALDCDEAEIRLTQVESFGVRLEARLPAVSDEPRSLMIEIIGSAKASPGS
jgi:hypothetical protein